MDLAQSTPLKPLLFFFKLESRMTVLSKIEITCQRIWQTGDLETGMQTSGLELVGDILNFISKLGLARQVVFSSQSLWCLEAVVLANVANSLLVFQDMGETQVTEWHELACEPRDLCPVSHDPWHPTLHVPQYPYL